MNLVPLAAVTRGNQLESTHFGAAVVVDLRGKRLFSAGDPDFLTFTRSTIKPFQTMPFLQDGGLARFGYGMREVALMCASHSGEPMHIAVVRNMLQKAGCEEHHLRCGCHMPISYTATGKQASSAPGFNQLYNNCSGKHAGFLAYCVQHGLSLDDYIDVRHPLQQRIRNAIASVADVAGPTMPAGIDGCSAPNYALPLSRLAYAYARLAQGANDTQHGDTMRTLFQAMTSHPELVSGSGRADLAFMRTAPGDWVAKGGAEGVQVIGIRSAGIGVALKVADGNARALYPATIAVLQQIGVLESAEATALEQWSRPQIHNLRGLHTGEIKAMVELKQA